MNLQVNYDRNTYTLTYNTDSESYLPTETKLFGAPLEKPDNPVKSGYTFVKWVDEEGVEFDFTGRTMPARDMMLKAIWIEGQTPYRIVYYVQNVDGNGYTLMGYVTKEGKTGDPVQIPEKKDQDPTIKYSFPGMRYWDSTIEYWMNKDSAYTEDGLKKWLVGLYFDKAYRFNQEKTQAENKDKLIANDGSTTVPLYFERQVYTLIVGGSPNWTPSSGDQHLRIEKDEITYDENNLYKIHVRFGEDFTRKMPKPDEFKGLTANQQVGDYMILGDPTSTSVVWLGDELPHLLDFSKVYVDSWTGNGAAGDRNYPNVLWLYMRPIEAENTLKVQVYYQNVSGEYKEEDSVSSEIPLDDKMWFYGGKVLPGFSVDETKLTIVKIGEWNIAEQKYEYPNPPERVI